jgi:hypothetical protein
MLLLLTGLLSGCGSTQGKVAVYQNEGFEANETFSRLFDASAEATCEAARRTLLSQGYLPTTVKPDFISASKHFQPDGRGACTDRVQCRLRSGRPSRQALDGVCERHSGPLRAQEEPELGNRRRQRNRLGLDPVDAE